MSLPKIVLFASLVCESCGYRVRPSTQADETSPGRNSLRTQLLVEPNIASAFNPSGPGALSLTRQNLKASAVQGHKNPALAHSSQKHDEAFVRLEDTGSVQRVQSPVMNDEERAPQASPPSAQASTSRTQSETLWWSKVLGVRWAVLAVLATLFSRFRPSSSVHENICRSGQVVASGGGDERDASLVSEADFTQEEREFFLSRPRKASRREIALTRGWGSAALISGTVLSLWLANSRFASVYTGFWETVVGYGPSAWHLQMSVRDWVNEAVMAFFFFSVGMEIKREVIFGSLRSLRAAALPCVAAIGGMLVPTALYCGVQTMTKATLAGWAIPMATDIAFAMGIYNMFRSRMPLGVGAFLLTLATVDDLGAIAVIAVAFAKHIDKMFLGGAGLICLVLELFRRCRIRKSAAWISSGIALWYCLLRGGVNADVAGVIVAFFIPTVAAPRYTKAQGDLPNLLDHYIHCWTGWSNFLIMPLFAIANTAVPLEASAGMVARSPVAQGILAGLLLGKPLGIAGASLLSLKLGWCEWPTGMKPIHLGICGLLGGIAFTMSLFLIEQSLVGSAVMFAKLAVIGGSTAAALAATAIMMGMRMPSEETLVADPEPLETTAAGEQTPTTPETPETPA